MPPKKQLLADDSEESGDEVNQLTINKDYAERYDNWRKKEEYQKLKDKYGENVLSEGSELSDSDTDDSSDSDQEELDRKLHSEIFDKNFIELYKALKKDDPKLYDESYSFAPKPEEKDGTNDPTEKKSKSKKNEKMTLLDYHVKLVKERGGRTEEDENQASTSTSYYEQLDSIKEEFKQVLEDSDEEDLITGVKPTDLDDSSNSSDVKLEEPRDDDEKFLYDFILNKRYLDGVSAPKQKKKQSKGTRDEVDDEEDATKQQKHLDVKQYRFEEPGGTEIQRFPRDIDSARDLSSKEEKAEKRKELKERKRREREEDLKRFTQLKRDELTEKLKTLRDTSGNDAFLQSSKDITSLIDDDVFDPDKHDQQMAKLFGDGYYADENDKEKPQFEYIEGLDDDINDDDQDDEEMGNILESDEGEEDQTEEASSSTKKSARSRRREKKKERKRKEKKLDLDKIPDYDDVIAGELPVRFKYRKVKPNDYGLSTEEILNAEDKELNKWVSLKKAVACRPEEEEERDFRVYQNRKNNTRYKMKILKSLFKDEEDGTDGNEEKQSKKKRKRKRKAKVSTTNLNEEEEEHDANEETEDAEKIDQDSKAVGDETEVVQPLSKTKQKKLKYRAITKKKQEAQLERLQAYGLSKREIKRRKLNL